MLFAKQLESIYRSNLFVRQDNAGGIFYFSPADFPGLQAHPYDFTANAGHALKGFFYHYADPIPGRLLVFDHGMGNGHRAYMREIEELCRRGFLVYSYDHTGCMASGGESTNGFATSLSDLDACISALNAEPALSGRSLSVIGHSWGGFSTMNIAAIHPEITHVVSMSGFISVPLIVRDSLKGPLALYRDRIIDLERRSNPDYVDFNAVRSLRKTDARVLLIYSDDDKTVSKHTHYDELHRMLSGKENIRFLLVSGKNHNPSYTAEAVRYKDHFFAAYQKESKKLTTPEAQKAFMDGYNWLKMTEQDMAVWDAIESHLKS